MIRSGLVAALVAASATVGGVVQTAAAHPGGHSEDHRAPLVAAHSDAAVPGRYIVVLHPRTSVRARAAAERQAQIGGGRVTTTYGAALKGFAAHLTPDAVDALRRNPDVAYVEADQVVTVASTQRDATWGLDRVDQRKHRLNQKYTYDNTGAGVTAYVLDTGIRAGHRQFGGRVTSGFTAVHDGRGSNDCYGHGTHVAGTIGSKKFGVAKRVTLTPVRVLNCQGRGTTSQIIAGLDWVTDQHTGTDPAVANMSIGGPASQAEDLAVTNSILDGITYAVAAGNETHNACQNSPADAGPAITVGATDRGDKRSYFSNFGNCVDIFAPGSDIKSTWNTSNRATKVISGTSMATPHVTGAAALYLQKFPGASPADVTDALLGAATTGALSKIKSSPNRLLFTRVSTPPATPSGGNLLLNPGFERGEHGWSASRGVITNSSDRPARSGSWKAWLNGYGDEHTDVVAQRVTIPAASSATLSFYLRVTTEESGGSAFDFLQVRVIDDGTGQTLTTYSNLDAGGYQLRTVDLSSYVGRTVTVELVGTEDGTQATDFVVDDTSLTVG